MKCVNEIPKNGEEESKGREMKRKESDCDDFAIKLQEEDGDEIRGRKNRMQGEDVLDKNTHFSTPQTVSEPIVV